MAWFTYNIYMVCNNCGFKNQLRVQKGVKVDEFVESKNCKCIECGCQIEPDKEGWQYTTDYLK